MAVHNNSSTTDTKRRSFVLMAAEVVVDARSNKRPRRTRQRSVRFDETCNIFIPNPLVDTECRELWYSRNEYGLFRSMATQEVKQQAASLECQSFCDIVQRTYDACCDQTRQSHEEAERQQQQQLYTDSSHCRILSEKEEQEFDWLVAKESGCLGLERAMVRRVAKDRCERRRHIVLVVQRVQQMDNDELWSWTNSRSSQKDHMLKLVCEEISRASCLFARYMARAAASGGSESRQ